MADATLDVVERVLDEVDKSRDVDWTILGERLRSAILDSGEHVDAGFTEAQKAAIVAVCRETYYATSVVARIYSTPVRIASHFNSFSIFICNPSFLVKQC